MAPSNVRFRGLLEEIVGSQHYRSFSLDWPFEELTRCSLLNRVAQPHKLIYSLICPRIMLAFKIVHRRGTDRTPHCLALIKHREINDHPIEVVAQHFTSLQRHCKSSAALAMRQALPIMPLRSIKGHNDASRIPRQEMPIGRDARGRNSSIRQELAARIKRRVKGREASLI
jgi:hypothetical protein